MIRIILFWFLLRWNVDDSADGAGHQFRTGNRGAGSRWFHRNDSSIAFLLRFLFRRLPVNRLYRRRPRAIITGKFRNEFGLLRVPQRAVFFASLLLLGTGLLSKVKR